LVVKYRKTLFLDISKVEILYFKLQTFKYEMNPVGSEQGSKIVIVNIQLCVQIFWFYSFLFLNLSILVFFWYSSRKL